MEEERRSGVARGWEKREMGRDWVSFGGDENVLALHGNTCAVL